MLMYIGMLFLVPLIPTLCLFAVPLLFFAAPLLLLCSAASGADRRR